MILIVFLLNLKKNLRARVIQHPTIITKRYETGNKNKSKGGQKTYCKKAGINASPSINEWLELSN